MTQIWVVIGVAGSGKTTVGRLLAQRLGWAFVDADDYHPVANVDKMRQGLPLTDADRWPWLAVLHQAIRQWQAMGQNTVLACSALKQSYRERLQGELPPLAWIYLQGEYRLLRQRLLARTGHFMGAELLRSQFATLEPPPDALGVSIDQPTAAIVAEILSRLEPSGHRLGGLPPQRSEDGSRGAPESGHRSPTAEQRDRG